MLSRLQARSQLNKTWDHIAIAIAHLGKPRLIYTQGTKTSCFCMIRIMWDTWLDEIFWNHNLPT